MGETNANTKENLKFRGGIFMSLVPVAIFFGFCVVLFVIFKAFNMEALAMGGFVALLVGGVFCTSYTMRQLRASHRSQAFLLSLFSSLSVCSAR